jgi:ectoine hydroxylase-related dioxygenase (phytanoyl-CoA dioxygenase family)
MTRSDASVVEPVAIDDYRRDGVAVLRQAFDPTWIEMIRDAMPALLEDTYDPNARVGVVDDGPTIRQCDSMWRESAPFTRFLFQSPIGPLAASVMGSRQVRLYEDLMIYTEAGAVTMARWHRDEPMWPLRGSQICSVWFSLEPVDADTGAMRFVLGSHRDPADPSRSLPSADLAPQGDADRLLVVPTDPGDAVVFHPRIRHTAYGSAADRPRRSFTVRFVGDDVRWRPRRAMYHPWMYDCGLVEGDVLDHPWFPVVAEVDIDRATTGALRG